MAHVNNYMVTADQPPSGGPQGLLPSVHNRPVAHGLKPHIVQSQRRGSKGSHTNSQAGAYNVAASMDSKTLGQLTGNRSGFGSHGDRVPTS